MNTQAQFNNLAVAFGLQDWNTMKTRHELDGFCHAAARLIAAYKIEVSHDGNELTVTSENGKWMQSEKVDDYFDPSHALACAVAKLVTRLRNAGKGKS